MKEIYLQEIENKVVFLKIEIMKKSIYNLLYTEVTYYLFYKSTQELYEDLLI
jgi:hypothetical protein